MTLRPPPGPQLAVGRLRVDAARAIVKLREYQLIDRTAWVLEAIRAAVASGATSIELRGDSNDVWLRWSGEPWPADELPRLFDELVSPEPALARHGIRLLAAAVNSALGMDPAHVDVIAISATGTTGVRYTPEVLEDPGGDLADAPLRRLTAEVLETPEDATPGMLVHVRRRAGLEVIGFWLRGAEPPEIALARASCESIAVPLRIGSLVLDRKNLGNDLLRVPLGDGLDGFLAITDPASRRRASPGVTMEIAERGVLLETSSLELDLHPRHTIPIRLLIDAPKMPTNASRSEVRRDTHPMTTAIARGRLVVAPLIDALVRTLSVEPVDPRARSAALGLIASVIAGPDWAETARALIGPMRALADLPLLRDATGNPRPVAWSWRSFHHTGRSPLSASLAPWMNYVLWIPPDDPAAWLVGHSSPERMKQHLRWARREFRAEKKFMRHAQRQARVLGRRRPRIRARLGAGIAESCIDGTSFEGFTGEVCLYDQRGGTLVVLLAGRELERITFDSAIGFEAVIDGSRVRPADHYRGVARDGEYIAVERALRAGLLRAIEAFAAVAMGGECPDGIEIAGDDAGTELVWFRDAYRLARELQVEIRPPLSSMPLWPEITGMTLSLDALRDQTSLGTAPLGSSGPGLSTRHVIVVDEQRHAELARLLPWVPIVRYQPHHLASASDSRALASSLQHRHAHVLAIGGVEQGCAIATAPEGDARLVIRHRGVRLSEQPYRSALVPCVIAIESDSVVPGDGWTSVAALGTVADLDLAVLERTLIRAAAHAIVGERSPSLIGAAPVILAAGLGRALCHAVLATNPRELLGDELIAKLRTQPLLTLLGAKQYRLHSMDEVALLFPESIPFVEALGEPVVDFTPVVAPGEVVRAVAALTGRQSRNAASELEARRTAVVRDLRIGRHCEQSRRPLTLPGGVIGVELDATIARGVVGVGRDVLEIHVHVAGRPFQVITRPGEPPLLALVEVAAEHTTPDFEALKPQSLADLITAVRDVTPALLVEIAQQQPNVLADASPERDLATSWFSHSTLSRKKRDRLRGAITFPTVQGGRTTLGPVVRSDGLEIASWAGAWEPPLGDEVPDNCDRPILLVPDSDTAIRSLIHAIYSGTLVDLTSEVTALQARRRMARGLLPKPRVTAPAELTRALDSFGDAASDLGIGEIALVGGPSLALIHVHGELRARIPIDVLPAVHVALEAPELLSEDQNAFAEEVVEDPIAQLRMLASDRPRLRMFAADIQRIAILLAQQVLTTLPERALSAEIRHSVRRAILTGRLDARSASVPVFETTTGAWVTVERLVEQRRALGQVWAVPRGPQTLEPLDERRFVLVLSADELALAIAGDLGVIDATRELELDARTRINRARPPAPSLELRTEGLLAEVALDGDGVTAPRGRVGVLNPRHVDRRRLFTHRKLHPFDELPDPCPWPTVAMVDDARLEPDRTWERPLDGAVLDAVKAAVRAASEAAIASLAQPPAHALASIPIVPALYLGLPSLASQTKVAFRGALWLAGPPTRASNLRVMDAISDYAFDPGIPGIEGAIYVHGPYGWSPTPTVHELCALLHGKLVRELLATERDDLDLVTAHAARALSLARISVDDAATLEFTCFARSLSATELVALFASDSPVDDPPFVDDRSELARVVRDILGPRLLPGRGVRRAPTRVEPARHAVARHPLQDFVDMLQARIAQLSIPPYSITIAPDRAKPIVEYADGALVIAGKHPRVLSMASACHARSPGANDALDLLAAHVLTVLNVALESVTDAAERGALLALVAAEPS